MKNIVRTEDIISALLSAEGTSQREFAEKIGYSEQAVHYWISGKRGFTYDSFLNICNACGYDVIIQRRES